MADSCRLSLSTIVKRHKEVKEELSAARKEMSRNLLDPAISSPEAKRHKDFLANCTKIVLSPEKDNSNALARLAKSKYKVVMAARNVRVWSRNLRNKIVNEGGQAAVKDANKLNDMQEKGELLDMAKASLNEDKLGMVDMSTQTSAGNIHA